MVIQIFPLVDIKEPYGQLAMPNAYPALLELAIQNTYFEFLLAFKLKAVNIFFNYGELTGYLKKPWRRSDIRRHTQKKKIY